MLCRTFLLLALLSVPGGCASAPKCPPDLPRFLSYEEHGFGTESVWFSGAVMNVPWEGYASIISAEVLDDPPPALATPSRVSVEPSADCPMTSQLDRALRRNQTNIISGRGRLRDDGYFVVECICSVRKVEGLTAEQWGRLYAGG